MTDARLNLVDPDGAAWLSHSFAVLENLDISVGGLPEGALRIISKE